MVYQKEKRDEVRKQREEEKKKIDEEKRKHDEEERARRRSRRELITNEEEASKVKPDVEDGASESSTEDLKSIKKEDESVGKADVKEDKVKNSPATNHDSPAVVSRRGRKKKVIPSEVGSPHRAATVEKQDVNEDIQVKPEKGLSADVVKSGLDEESHVSSSVHDDSSKDEIPDADPELDKFIAQAQAPIDDEPLGNPEQPFVEEKGISSPKPTKVAPRQPSSSDLSPSSATKRKRQPPMHSQDYVSSLNLHKETLSNKSEKVGHVKKTGVKSARGINHSNPGLSDELDILASGFADGQGSPKLYVKKATTRGRGRRPSQGIVRSHIADSTTNEASEMSKDKWNNQSSPTKLTSSVGSKFSSPSGSAELSASKIFALQRAKGLKFMPPQNRHLSSPREQALGHLASDELAGKAERLSKGVKVLKGRRLSAESHTTEKKTENSHADGLQSGVSKKVRPVLSNVEDNGVSAEDDLEEKVVENGSIALPKQPQPLPLQSPPVKKGKPFSPKKQSPSIGVCSLWNQDLFLQ